jgi:hypothetical protein
MTTGASTRPSWRRPVPCLAQRPDPRTGQPGVPQPRHHPRERRGKPGQHRALDHRRVDATRLTSLRRLCSSRLPSARPSRPARTRSQVSTETAMTRCRSAATTGKATVADPSAIRASMWRSSPVSPITEGISSASRWRPASEVWSLTWRATAASSGWVHAGWSLQRSSAPDAPGRCQVVGRSGRTCPPETAACLARCPPGAAPARPPA